MSWAGNMEKPESRMTTTVAEGWRRGIRKSVVLNLGDFAAQGTFGYVLGLSLVGITGGGGATGTSRKRPGMLPNTLQCTGQPHSKELSITKCQQC